MQSYLSILCSLVQSYNFYLSGFFPKLCFFTVLGDFLLPPVVVITFTADLTPIINVTFKVNLTIISTHTEILIRIHIQDICHSMESKLISILHCVYIIMCVCLLIVYCF